MPSLVSIDTYYADETFASLPRFAAPFSWRYHAVPFDAYRYTHTGAQYLFERLGGMVKVFSGYMYCPWASIAGYRPSATDATVDGDPFPRPIEVL